MNVKLSVRSANFLIIALCCSFGNAQTFSAFSSQESSRAKAVSLASSVGSWPAAVETKQATLSGSGMSVPTLVSDSWQAKGLSHSQSSRQARQSSVQPGSTVAQYVDATSILRRQKTNSPSSQPQPVPSGEIESLLLFEDQATPMGTDEQLSSWNDITPFEEAIHLPLLVGETEASGVGELTEFVIPTAISPGAHEEMRFGEDFSDVQVDYDLIPFSASTMRDPDPSPHDALSDLTLQTMPLAVPAPTGLPEELQESYKIIPMNKLTEQQTKNAGPFATETLIAPLTNPTSLFANLSLDNTLGQGAYPADEVRSDTTYGSHGAVWSPRVYAWVTPTFAHRPLYFEQVNLERYGLGSRPLFKPAVSAAHFFSTIPVIPLKMAVKHPHECVYTLGYGRPGDCLPFQRRNTLFSAADKSK